MARPQSYVIFPRRWLLFLLAVLVPLLPTAAQTSASYTWKNVTIKGGGFVTGLVYHPTQANLLYARTDVGGAYRWNESAGQWIPLNDALGRNDSQLTGVLSVAVDPNDASRVYLACGQYTPSWASSAAVLASNDQGATWTRSNLSLKLGGNEDGRGTGERLQVDPNDGRILFLGTTNAGLWRSADRAVTWTKVAGFTPTAVTFVVFDAASGSAGSATPTVYVGVNGTTSALMRSTDGGTTWAAVPGQPSGLIPLHAKFSADRQLYISYSDYVGPNNATRGAVWRLNVATDAWTNISPPTGQGGFSGVAVDAQRPAVVLVSTLDRWSPRDELYFSSDRGTTWTALMGRSTRDVSAAPYAGSISPHWLADVEIDPKNSNRAWFVTGYGVFATDNLGAVETGGTIRWDFRDDGLEETVPLGIVSPPSGASLVSAIGDIDGFRHDSLDTSPASRHVTSYGTNNAIDFAELAPAVMVRTYGSGTRGGISRDGGNTWTAFANAPAAASANGVGTIAVAADGGRIIWAPTRSIPYWSADGGATWTASTGAPDPGSNSYSVVADRADAARCYVYDATAGKAYQSGDGGVTFSVSATVSKNGEMKASRSTSGGTLWLAAGDSGLWGSSSGVQGLTAVAGRNLQSAYRVTTGKSPVNGAQSVYIWGKVAEVIGLFRSDNAGLDWTRINDDNHQYGWVNAIAGDPRVAGRLFVATGGRGILYGEVQSQPALLAASDFAAFTIGTSGTYTPKLTRSANGAVFSAVNLPAWAQVNAATGVITGTPTDPAGTLRQITLRSTETGGVVAESTVNLFVAASGSSLAVTNLSARAPVGTGSNILIPGITIAGAGARSFLIRAVGPTLGLFGVDGVLANPQLNIMPQGSSNPIAANDNWEVQIGTGVDAEGIRQAGAAKSAFPLAAGSKDAAVVWPLSAGSYTVRIEGVDGTTGVALLELYDVTSGGGSARLSNISVRAVAGSGSNVLIAGISLEGTGSRRVLVRGVGPTLSLFGISGLVNDPQLTLNRVGDGGTSTVLATSGPWGQNANADDVRAAAQTVSAFGLPEGSNDAALLPLLVSGSYTIALSSKSGASGAALIEVYLLP